MDVPDQRGRPVPGGAGAVHGGLPNHYRVTVVDDNIDFTDFTGPSDTADLFRTVKVREVTVDLDEYYPPGMGEDELAGIAAYVDGRLLASGVRHSCRIQYRRSSSWGAIARGFRLAAHGGYHLRLVFQELVPGDLALQLRVALGDDPKRLLYDSRRARADAPTYLMGVLFDNKNYGETGRTDKIVSCGPWQDVGTWTPE